MAQNETILVLGATGASGLAFLDEALVHKNNPNLVLLVRTPSKLPAGIESNDRVRVIKGNLDNRAQLDDAMRGVTVVVSLVGGYFSLHGLLTRDSSTPIADHFPLVFDAMRSANVKRIFALSTVAFKQPGDEAPMKWWFSHLMVWLMVPGPNAEMRAIGEQVSSRDDLDWTVFRSPGLTDEPAGKELAVNGLLKRNWKGASSWSLSRKSQARWILDEIAERKWVKMTPVLVNI
ncbi:NADH(P)-binding-domain-containing protein [Lineolata rhizophorae]|uniref:NADH(P)-binding-domain-containing protein n=1 Tax=Lineolata rhizophorae TaxID=578093 RepID=A0A6A6P5X8_9PEZI|nr:NADH(P)-binding-domain-containing protein [Lineolata rhizophorae]